MICLSTFRDYHFAVLWKEKLIFAIRHASLLTMPLFYCIDIIIV